MANECTHLFRPGKDVTCLTTGAVTGKTFVAISAAPDTYGQLKVATATGAARAFGVAARDAASGARVLVLKQGIVPVTAGGTIAVGAEVEVGSGGKAVTLASGKAIGQAVSAGTNNADVFIDLY
ncbi:capsid cement protein [Nocardia xishanensis]